MIPSSFKLVECQRKQTEKGENTGHVYYSKKVLS